MQITFTYPQFLWFLCSIPFLIVLHMVAMRFTKRKAMLFANFEVIKRVGGEGFLTGDVLKKNILFLALRILVLSCISLSLAGMVVWYQGQSSTFDFILAIDASGSMLADDFEPNRITAAKEAALTFADSIAKKSKVAIVTFSGTTFVKQRLTDNLDQVRESIKNIDIAFASGTAIGDAIVNSANLFSEGERAKVIILITDGQSNVGLLAEEAIRYASKNQITVFTIGVATPEGGRFKEIDAVSRLDETTLKSIADGTGGKYYRADNKAQLSGAFKEIATTSVTKVPVRLAIPLLVAAISLLFFEWIMINTRYRTIP
jgi:Ca-activated chloride channel family protein